MRLSLSACGIYDRLTPAQKTRFRDIAVDLVVDKDTATYIVVNWKLPGRRKQHREPYKRKKGER